MIQLVLASTSSNAAAVAAAIDSGLLEEPSDERVLLVTNNASAPELAPSLDEILGVTPVLRRFDRVAHLTDLIAPTHPTDWNPDDRDIPFLSRLLRSYWEIGDRPIELVLESIATNPALALSKIFSDSPITVYSSDLGSYSPSSARIPLRVSQRLNSLLYLDILQEIEPILLSEFNIPIRAIDPSAFRSIVSEIPRTLSTPAREPNDLNAVVIGQNPNFIDTALNRTEITDVYRNMIQAALGQGVQRIHFKPHPSAPPRHSTPFAQACAYAGVEFEYVRSSLFAETYFGASSAAIVVGCFSTALMTSKEIFGLSTVAVNTSLALERVAPCEGSCRLPLTIVDASHRESSPYATTESLRCLICSVAYCMQPDRLPWQRPVAEAFLSSTPPGERRRYFNRRRLSALSLPS